MTIGNFILRTCSEKSLDCSGCLETGPTAQSYRSNTRRQRASWVLHALTEIEGGLGNIKDVNTAIAVDIVTGMVACLPA